MPENEIKREKIRNLLTPDVQVCGECRDKYKEEASCHSCGRNMLEPTYKGMVYECPLCAHLYCEDCWKKMEGGVHTVEKEGKLFGK